MLVQRCCWLALLAVPSLAWANASQDVRVSDFGFDAADFFMAHLNFKAVAVQNFKSLFQSRSYRADGTLPVLFLHYLRSVEPYLVGNLMRSLYVKLKLGSGGKTDLFDLIRTLKRKIFKYVRIAPECINNALFEYFFRIAQYCS
mgnify:CR=1 FL=1